jgi:hypothetical protein
MAKRGLIAKLLEGAELDEYKAKNLGVDYDYEEDFPLPPMGEPTAADLARLEGVRAPESTGRLPESALLGVSRENLSHVTPQLERLLSDPERLGRAIELGYLPPEAVSMSVEEVARLPNVVFHATRGDFDEFDMDMVDLGPHVGTRDQATDRMRHTRPGATGEERLIPLLTRVNSPMEMRDVGPWDNSEAVLWEMGQTTDTNSDMLNMLINDLEPYVSEQRAMFESPDEWVSSPENREALDELRDNLTGTGIDNINYRNTGEGTQGLKPEVSERIAQLRKEINEIDLQHWDNALGDLSPEGQRLTAAKQDEISALRMDPESVFKNESKIILDPTALRSPEAQFGTDIMSRTSPNLLASAPAAGVGAGLLGAGAFLSPQEAMAQDRAQRESAVTALRSIPRGIEGFGRGLLNSVNTLFSDDAVQARETPLVSPEATFVEPGPRAEELSQFAQRGLQSALDYQPPLRDQTVGQDIGDVAQFVSNSPAGDYWRSLDPDTQARLGAGADVGLSLFDAATLGAGAIPRKVAAEAITDPRFGKRITEKRAMEAGEYLSPEMEMLERPLVEVPEVSIADMEGQGIVSTMADQSRGGGVITALDGRELEVPVDVQAGQDYMLDQERHPGQVWAMGKGEATGLLKEAQKVEEVTGQPAVLAPWRMTPTGSDFSTHGGDLLLSNAITTMSKKQLKDLDNHIRDLSGKRTFTLSDGTKEQRVVKTGIPDWPGLAKDPDAAMAAWANASGDQRKEVKDKVLDAVRGDTGLSLPQARSAISDPSQIGASDMGLQNMGIIDLLSGPQPSPHRTYPVGIPGQPMGRIKEDITLYDIWPELQQKRAPYRAAMMTPLSAKITPSLIDRILEKQK